MSVKVIQVNWNGYQSDSFCVLVICCVGGDQNVDGGLQQHSDGQRVDDVPHSDLPLLQLLPSLRDGLSLPFLCPA